VGNKKPLLDFLSKRPKRKTHNIPKNKKDDQFFQEDSDPNFQPKLKTDKWGNTYGYKSPAGMGVYESKYISDVYGRAQGKANHHVSLCAHFSGANNS